MSSPASLNSHIRKVCSYLCRQGLFASSIKTARFYTLSKLVFPKPCEKTQNHRKYRGFLMLNFIDFCGFVYIIKSPTKLIRSVLINGRYFDSGRDSAVADAPSTPTRTARNLFGTKRAICIAVPTSVPTQIRAFALSHRCHALETVLRA